MHRRLSAFALAATLAVSACSDARSTTTFVQPIPGGGFVVADPVRVVPQPATGVRVGPASAPRAGAFSVAPPNAPSGPAVDAFARNFLDGIQARSIAERREYCGYFFIDGDGQLRATAPRGGTFASCDMPVPVIGQGVIASYHTHGAFDEGYDNEVPSVIDLTSDFDFGIDGYVSTPGGRVWLVDYQTLSTRQVCGLGCVTFDPAFRPVDEATIRPAFTLQSLQQRNRMF